MLKFCQNHKGSISIFLLCIITAMLFFSFLTLDIAKTNLATATARSNSDIVANAVLTDYDKLLKDAYGLFASSKNIDELSKNVTDYYIATMASSGIKVENKNEIYNAISSLITNSEISQNNNMLQLKAGSISLGENANDSGVLIQPVNESAISNPRVMRRQIVEYMKYRAPISLATGMLEKLNVIKDLDNQTAATTAKIKYEDSLNDVQRSSDVVYEIINAYIHNIKDITNAGYPSGKGVEYGGSTPLKITNRNNYGGSAAAVVNDNYNKLIQTLTAAAPLKDYANQGWLNKKRVKITIDNPDDISNFEDMLNNSSYSKLKGIYDRYGNYGYAGTLIPLDDYTTSNSADANTVYQLLHESRCLYDYSATDTGIGRFYKDFYKMYYYILENQEDLLEDETISQEDLNSYENVSDVLSWAFGYPEVDDWYLDYDFPSASDGTASAVGKLMYSLYNKANEDLEILNSSLNDVVGTLFHQMKMAEYMSGNSSPLDILRDDIEDAINNCDTWEQKIEGVETDSYRASMKDNFIIESKDFDKLSTSDVDNMKAMFGQHYNYYKGMYDNFVSKYQYLPGNSSDKLFNGMDNIATAGVVFRLPRVTFSTPQTVCDDIWRNAPVEVGTFSQIVSSNQSQSPVAGDLKCADFAAEILSGANNNIYNIVKKISEKNIIKDTSQKEETEKKGKEQKNAIKNAKKDNEDALLADEVTKESESSGKSTNDMSDVADVTTYAEYIKENATEDYKFGDVDYSVGSMEPDDDGNYDTSGITNLLEQIGGMFANLANAARDNLYVAEYLTGTFSCLTTGLEDGDDKTDEKPEKSITGLALNPDNNKHYQAEMEYILYGFETEAGNKAAAIGIISGIRFALNLIYSFTDAEINSFTTSTAASIGVLIPFSVPIIKTVLHILLSAAETAWDVLELTKGNAVPLYKSSATWVCKGSNIIKNVAIEATEKVVKELTNALEDGISDYVSGKSEDITEWTKKMTTKKKDELKGLLQSKVITPVNDFVVMMVGEVNSTSVNISDKANELLDNMISDLETSIAEETAGDAMMSGLYNTILSYIKEQKSSLVSKITSFVNQMAGNATDYLNNFETKFNNLMSGVNKNIDDAVEALNGAIEETVSAAAKEVKDLAIDTVDMAGDKLMNAVETKISEKLSGRNVDINMGSGSGKTSGKGSALSALLNMTYKDYLYVFLIIGTIGSTDKVLERAAQLMEVNIEHQSGKEYDINKGVTMFNIYTSAKVKTSIMGRYADNNGITLKNFSDGYYNIELRSFAGY